MNKILLTLSLGLISVLSSCGGGQKMTESQLESMADSLAAPKVEAINAKATQDCEARMITEVKTISDSLIKNP